MHPTLPIAFAGNPLDRANTERRDPAWVEAQRRHPRAELLVLWRGQVLHEAEGDAAALLPLTLAALEAMPGSEPVLLGLREGTPVWAADAGDVAEPPFAALGAYEGLRALGGRLPPSELSVAGQAAWLLGWHDRHRFCARTGRPTVVAQGGAKRVEPESGTEHFPRSDPVAIVLPTLGERACLGRGPHFPPGMHSAFAGFVEACEAVEECAVRELYEETGLIVRKLTYVASQPWPFPSSLMIGFLAEVETETLRLDPEEIAEARWVSRAEARALLGGGGPAGLSVPPGIAIAHQLLRAWAED
ncbi:NAD(+) diphosphatase [Parvularcula dongshanensis]|uniref:NAD(+) diphosphatase n=1 Tax=Parvularcula dongshanensis TaxID=1173995 RepID=A0A840I1H0_9PROT|nr:NAD(+) diphosphatase [Parvularcula dongshanensis]MBB4657920.1 NAD+ diphosphatase [Parvularcula dongshanensis]